MMERVSERDELPHRATAELQWGESYAFELYDPSEAIGGSTRLCVRPNEGAMDVGVHFFLPDGGFVAAHHVKATSENTAELEVGAVCYRMLDPLRRWRISYDGPAHFLRSATDAAKPEAWHKSRLERLSVDLEFEAWHAPDGAAGEGFFEQAGRWSGTVWVSGDEYRIRGFGVRERVWGVRDWQAPRMWRRFSASFGDDCALVALRVGLPGGDLERGWIRCDGRNVSVRSVDVVTEVEAGSHLQKAVRLSLGDADGAAHEILAEVMAVAPLRRTRNQRETLVCEGLARFTYQGRTGYGIAEYLHQLDGEGRPLVPIA